MLAQERRDLDALGLRGRLRSRRLRTTMRVEIAARALGGGKSPCDTGISRLDRGTGSIIVGARLLHRLGAGALANRTSSPHDK